MAASAGDRWRGRPVLTALLRAAILLLPVAVAVATAAVLSRLLPEPGNWAELVAWWVLILATSTLVLLAMERVARELLPLAALLPLSLLFPGPPPSRWRVARKSSVRDLKTRVAELQARGVGSDATRAAETILTLVAALNTHDRTTRGHSERVRVLADLLAEELKLEPEAVDRLRWAALLHDVGKLVVPPEILVKDGPLDEAEWEIVRRHPAEGDRFAAPLRPWLGEWVSVIGQHHERFDGGGYPSGLSGGAISLGARIVTVADSYETMTSVRSYQRPITPAAGRAELVRCSGSQFDPDVVRAFLNLSTRRLWLVAGPLAWLAQVPVVGAVAHTGEGAPVAAKASALTAKLVSSVAAVSLMGAGHLATPRAFHQRVPAAEAAAAAEETTTSLSVTTTLRSADRSPAPSRVSAAPTTSTSSVRGSGASASSGETTTSTSEATDAASTTSTTDEGGTTETTQTTDTSGANHPPRAAPDSATTTAGASVRIDVTANDTDTDDNLDPSTVTVVRPPDQGRTSVGSQGVVTYTPATSASGSDRFFYRVCDTAGACDRAIVDIEITAGP